MSLCLGWNGHRLGNSYKLVRKKVRGKEGKGEKGEGDRAKYVTLKSETKKRDNLKIG